MVTYREIQNEMRRRKREEDKKFLDMLRDNTPEGQARLQQYLKETEQEKANQKKELDDAVAAFEEEEKRKEQATLKAADDILHGRVLQRMGDYRKLFFYRKSKVIFDLTFHFCARFIASCGDRTKDQMVQAARSGKQNFVEGIQDGQANFEQVMYLVTIGQGSLQELREDYEDYIRTRGLVLWSNGHQRYDKMVEFCKTNNDIEAYAPLFGKMNDEELANLALTLIHQTDFLIEGFLKKLEKKFIEQGGVKEQMSRIRKQALGKGYRRF